MLVAQPVILFQRLLDDPLKFGGQFRIEPRRRYRRLVKDGIENGGGCCTPERHRPRSHFVKHSAKRKKIGARVELFSHRLFRRHVHHRTHSRPGCAEQLLFKRSGQRRGRHSGKHLLSRQDLGKAEVEHLGLFAAGAKNICGLDVAVNDSLCMGRIEGVRDFDADLEQMIHRQWTARDPAFQRLPVQKLHGDEMPSLVFVNFIDRADVRMAERRSSACLASKTLERRPIAPHFFGKKLQGNRTAQFGVLRLVYNTHAAAPEHFDDAIVRNGLANHG